MAENTMHKAFPFTAFVSHLHYPGACREVVTVSASNHNSMSEKSLDERRAELADIREKHPNLIPVIIQESVNSQIRYGKKKLFMPPKFSLAEAFTQLWNQLYEIKLPWATYSLVSTIKHKDPIFEISISSVYKEFKDEDGWLYITLSGETRDINTEPTPSNISTYTDYVPKQSCKDLKDSEKDAARRIMEKIHIVRQKPKIHRKKDKEDRGRKAGDRVTQS